MTSADGLECYGYIQLSEQRDAGFYVGIMEVNGLGPAEKKILRQKASEDVGICRANALS